MMVAQTDSPGTMELNPYLGLVLAESGWNPSDEPCDEFAKRME